MTGTEKQCRWAEDIKSNFLSDCSPSVISRVAESVEIPETMVVSAKENAAAEENSEVWICMSDFDAFEILRTYSESLSKLHKAISANRPEKFPENINLKAEKEALHKFLLSCSRNEPDWASFREQESRLAQFYRVVKLGKKWKVAQGTQVKVTKAVLDSGEDKEGEGTIIGMDEEYLIVQFLKLGYKNPKKIHIRFFLPVEPIFLDNTLWLPTGKRHFVCSSLRINIS